MVYAKVMLAEISSSLRLPKALGSRCLDSGRSLDLSCALHKRDQCSSMLSSILPGKLYAMWGICTFHIWTFLSTRQPHGMRVSRKVQAPVWLASHARLYSCLPCFQKSAKSADGSHLMKTVKFLGTGPWDRGNFDVPPGVLTLYWSLSGNKLHTPFGINVTVSSCSIRRARDASAMPHLIRHIISCTTPSVVPIPLRPSVHPTFLRPSYSPVLLEPPLHPLINQNVLPHFIPHRHLRYCVHYYLSEQLWCVFVCFIFDF